MKKKYNVDKNVLEAARERYAFIFDTFETIYVSVSAGKDSTVLFDLAVREAAKRNRYIHLFFLDQEAEYQATIDLMEKMMRHPHVIPLWYQVPIYMTNSTSYQEEFLYAWGEGELWMRPKSDIAIHSIDEEYPQRFYEFFPWFEERQPDNSAFLVGLRADESLNRFRAVTKHPGYEDVLWSSPSANPRSYKFYPLYDWAHTDVWKYIDDRGIEYNAIYDKMFANNHSIYSTMRVSNLIHEKSYSCLADLQALEPETYERLMKRLNGVHCAAHYVKREHIYKATELPEQFASWLEYRDYLLETTPYQRRQRFEDRFTGQPQDEYTYRQQVGQLLINDWENNIPVKRRSKKRRENLERWAKVL